MLASKQKRVIFVQGPLTLAVLVVNFSVLTVRPEAKNVQYTGKRQNPKISFSYR